MSHSIAFINQKGGVGKTTLVANAGAWWGRKGHRVLLIDLDPQAHLTLHFHTGIDEEKRDEHNIYRILRGECSFAESVQALPEESLDLIPSHIDLSAAEWELGQEVGREVILRDKLVAFLEENTYDVVLIDCPPSLGLLSLNALAAVDEVVVPVQAEFFALLGMAQLMRVIDLVRSRLHPTLQWRVVVPTLVDLRTNLGRDVIGELEGHVPGMVTENWLTKRVKVAEAPSHGMSIFAYAGDTPAAEEFRKVCDEIATRIELATPSAEAVATAKSARLAAVARAAAAVAQVAAAQAEAEAIESRLLDETSAEATVVGEPPLEESDVASPAMEEFETEEVAPPAVLAPLAETQGEAAAEPIEKTVIALTPTDSPGPEAPAPDSPGPEAPAPDAQAIDPSPSETEVSQVVPAAESSVAPPPAIIPPAVEERAASAPARTTPAPASSATDSKEVASKEVAPDGAPAVPASDRSKVDSAAASPSSTDTPASRIPVEAHPPVRRFPPEAAPSTPAPSTPDDDPSRSVAP